MTILLAAIPIAYAVDLPPETYYQATDTGLNGDDTGSGALPIGFTFNFFGNDYTELYASSNGYLTFSSDDQIDFTNDDIPHSNNPDNYIAPFWDDITVYSSDKAKVYYKTIGTAPNRKMVVQWTNVYFFNTNIPMGTFQAILYEGSNEIQLQYRYIVTSNSRALGDSATVGIENIDGSAGVEFSYNTTSLSSGKVIRFIPDDATYTIKNNNDYDAVLLGGGATEAPAIPTPSCPPHQGEDDLQPLFAWLDAANADSFRLIVDDANDFDSPVIDENGITGTTYTPTTALTDSQTYYWAVIAENATDSSWSEQQSFTTNGSAPGFPPCTPLLSTPLAQARAVSTNPTFSWQAAVNADYYQLIVSTNADLSDPVFDENNITTTSKAITGLDEGPIFYWKVIAHNTYGGTDSSIRNFTTADAAPIAPSALNATGISNSQIDLQWTDNSNNEQSFVISYANTSGGKYTEILVATSDLSGTGGTETYSHTGLTCATTYYYLIKARNGFKNDSANTSEISGVTSACTSPYAITLTPSVTSFNEGETLSLDGSFTDPDSNESRDITIDWGDSSNNTTFTLAADVTNFNGKTHSYADNGTYTITVTVSDGTSNPTQTTDVTVNNVAPSITQGASTSVNMDEDANPTPFSLSLNATDAGTADILTWSISSNASNGTANVSGTGNSPTILNYTPNANFNGSDSFVVQVSDNDGDTDTITVNITVTAVNDAPTTADKTVTVNEDEAYTFAETDFEFTDVDTGNSLNQIQITELPTIGTLQLDGVDVTVDQEIAVADIPKLTFTPAANANGSSYATFKFKVHDGTSYSDADFTMTIDVTAVNDAPTNTVPNTETTNEDTPLIFSTANSNLISISDIEAEDALGQPVTVNLTATNGTLTLSSTTDLTFTDGDGTDDASMEFSGTVSDSNTALAGMIFMPTSNYNGSASVHIIINDGTSTDEDTINITVNAVNDAPTTADKTVTLNEDATYTFTEADFEFTDIDSGNSLNKIQITQLPTIGTLQLDGVDVIIDQEIAVADIPKLTFTPAANANGSGYATFKFKVHDGTSYSDADFTMTVDVTAVNDAPTTADKTVTVNEDEAYTFTETDFEFSDVETGNSLNKIKITQLPTIGTLQLDGADVTIDQEIAVADIPKLTFAPAANANGNGYATFKFKVHDGTSYSNADFTMTVDVTAVNDAPATADKIVTVNEDQPYTFTEADFEFTDIDSGNSLNKIQITQLPTIGTLQLDGVDVIIDQIIAVADISKLTFTPVANANGTSYATFKFKVYDGTSYSDADFTMTVDVTAVNDIPSFTKGDDQTVVVNAEQNIAAWASNIDAGSTNESSQTLSFTVTNDNNSLFSVQPAIDASGHLTFTPSTVGNVVVTVILSDGIDTSAAQTFNIKVNPLPASAPTQQTTPEPTGCTLASNINCAVKNEGTITDVKIEPEGSIEGGTLEGEINNEGTLTDVTLAEGTKIEGGTVEGTISGNPEAPAILINVKITAKAELSHVILEKNVELPNDVTLKDVELRGSSVNGGKLEGTIRTTSSATVIKNVSLGENATIIGGKLAGTISGTPKNPAVLQHLTVEPQTHTHDVIISDGVEMPVDVNLASGVRFTKTENIPADVDLTETLPKKGQSVDLSADPVVGGEGILPAINRLQEFVPAELTVLQHDKGFIYLDIEGIRYAVNPMKVKHLSEAERLQLESGQTVRFKTDTQIDVLAPPAVQDISSFKQSLSKINLPEVNISNDGNIKVPATETIWYSGRPDLASRIVDKDTANGFITKEDGNVALIFEDETGEKREQILYPSPADMSALGKFDLTPNGILEFEINGQKFKGRLDYQVKQGKATSETVKVTEIADSNDVMITYPDGAEQLLFALPK